MRKKSKLLAIIIVSFILLFSCNDILEDDISNDTISIIFPNEGDLIEGNTVQFSWNNIDGVNQYTLQVYDDNTILIDTVLTSSPFSTVLNPNNYQWRIKGSNNAYETDFTFPVNFEVVTSLDLSNQTVVLTSPTNNLYTNNPSIIFTWDTINSAETYTFELVKITSSGNVTIFLQEDIVNTSLSLDNTVITEDAQYQWRIKAVNQTSETDYSSRDFFIDTVSPPTPSLLTPQFEEIFSIDETITFSWSFGTDPGVIESIITSFFDIATDENFVTIIESGNSINTNFNSSFNNAGTYYWRVKGEDDAGNIGSYNLNGKFIIQ